MLNDIISFLYKTYILYQNKLYNYIPFYIKLFVVNHIINFKLVYNTVVHGE